jgi:hypothetical protein
MIDPDRDHDPNRQRIDDTISAALGLPSLAVVAREPGLNAKDINPRPDSDDDDEEE